jgi:hypothetical protein
MSVDFEDQATSQIASIRYQQITPAQGRISTWLTQKGLAKDAGAANALVNKILITGIVLLTLVSIFTFYRVLGDPEAPPVRREYQNGATGESFISQ